MSRAAVGAASEATMAVAELVEVTLCFSWDEKPAVVDDDGDDDAAGRGRFVTLLVLLRDETESLRSLASRVTESSSSSE